MALPSQAVYIGSCARTPWYAGIDVIMPRNDQLLLVATDHGVVVARGGAGDWREQARVLSGHNVTGIVSREGVILAATTDGVYRSDDAGRSWREASDGLSIRHARWLAYHPDIADLELVGTEPAGLFVSHDGAAHWWACPEVEELRDRFGWFLPYSPEAGCVRGFAFHGRRAYAAVEVGGVLRSDDAGDTWRLADGSTGQPVFDIPPAPLVFADVHSVAVHPSSADLVFAATAEGLYRSADGGATWEVSHAGSYCRAVWIDPTDARHILLGPADSVARKNGRVERSLDGGSTWEPASEGLDLPWPDRMVERLLPVDGSLLVITNDGRLYAGPNDGSRWQRALPDVAGIQAATAFAG